MDNPLSAVADRYLQQSRFAHVGSNRGNGMRYGHISSLKAAEWLSASVPSAYTKA
jgi:hypothetical protein